MTDLCFFADGGVQLQIHYTPWSAKRKKLYMQRILRSALVGHHACNQVFYIHFSRLPSPRAQEGSLPVGQSDKRILLNGSCG
ncbi:hypothetical protein CXF85_02815 [Colwellia sp. 75C3]|uniref:hypothetical protein n=1 Tax=Colwellia sp. 75C3 TaxID=888425 RepID=UPI000C345A62|nr:hypothetical protein [Colwellia sp. 75C3]PKG85738.1 hypothetical protein CXF85_02815 [Colwellia sp. 75C3]